MTMSPAARTEAPTAWAELPPPRNERVRKVLEQVRGPRILHVGCVNHELPTTPEAARDHLHLQLCRQFASDRVVGVDLNADAVATLRAQGMEVIAGDAHEMAFDGEFDTVLAGELIEHLENPGRFLAACRRALKPGGRLVLSTPNPFAPMMFLMYAKNFDRAFNTQHTQWFCAQTIQELLRRTGFPSAQIEFVDDHKPDLIPSPFYRSFVYAWRAVRWSLPERFRTTMVIVCT